MTLPLQGTVRYGTRRLAVALGHERYVRAFDTHLRSIVHPPLAPGDPADLAIEVVDRDRPVESSDPDVDQLQVERQGTMTTWRSRAGTATLQGQQARIEMVPAAVVEHELLFAFSVLVQQLLLSLGLLRLHAAGVVVGDRTVVLVGEKGAGKSTLTLSLGRHGALVLGDDQLALEAAGSSVIVAGSYPGIRLTAEAERLLPEPLTVTPVVLAGVAKKEVPLEAVVPAAPYEPFHPTDLWFPQVGARFEVAPMHRREALTRLVGALAPLHRFADGRDRTELVDLVAKLVECTQPCRVTLPRDLDDLGLVWDELTS